MFSPSLTTDTAPIAAVAPAALASADLAATGFIQPERILGQIGLLPGMQAADLGCGSGYFSLPAARMVGSKGRVFSIDVQKSVLEQVRKQAQLLNINNLETVWSDLEIVGATKISPNSLDMVFLVNTLFQIKDKMAALSEAKRLVKPGGTLLIVDWLPGDTGLGPLADKRLNLAEIKQMAVSAGFTEKSTIDAGTHHFGLVFQAQ
jgi:ubiquinone/menaquinone biosynthesis C-methylase UbiE